MNTCGKCGREYLDAYDECPFCERATAAEIPQMPEAEQTGRSRISLFIRMTVAVSS